MCERTAWKICSSNAWWSSFDKKRAVALTCAANATFAVPLGAGSNVLARGTSAAEQFVSVPERQWSLAGYRRSPG